MCNVEDGLEFSFDGTEWFDFNDDNVDPNKDEMPLEFQFNSELKAFELYLRGNLGNKDLSDMTFRFRDKNEPYYEEIGNNKIYVEGDLRSLIDYDNISSYSIEEGKEMFNTLFCSEKGYSMKEYNFIFK